MRVTSAVIPLLEVPFDSSVGDFLGQPRYYEFDISIFFLHRRQFSPAAIPLYEIPRAPLPSDYYFRIQYRAFPFPFVTRRLLTDGAIMAEQKGGALL